MTDQFVAEIRMFGGNFAPNGWATCDGQILSISQNTALFSLLGTYYGGNGVSNFALPNLEGSTPIHQGQQPGLTNRVIGETGGTQSVTLLTSEMPSHTHGLKARPVIANTFAQTPGQSSMAKPSPATNLAYQSNSTASLTALNPLSMSPSGQSQHHNNMQPYLCLFFIIALQGVYPTRP